MTLFPVGRSNFGKAAEKEWQETLFGPEGLFPLLRWACCHTFPLRTEHGWRTATSIKGTPPEEHGGGWPDWVCLRQQYVVAVEVKGYDKNGKPTPFKPGQIEWLERFARLEGGRAWVLRPTDTFEDVVSMARFPGEAPRRFGW